MTAGVRDRARPAALMFPGQGAQHQGMATGLYRSERVFADAMDSVFALLGAEGERVRADWLSDEPAIGIDDVRRAQPLLFAVGYALGRLLYSRGVRPTAMLGHSAGELVAATLAGVFELRDAVALVGGRVRHAATMPSGGMLAVAAAPDDLRPYLDDELVAIAAVNAPRQTMLAGPTAPLRAVEARLRADGVIVREVPSTSPFHSPVMAPVAAATERALGRARLRAPRLPVYSAYTGEVLGEQQARDPGFWARQVTDTVYFGPALDRLLADRDVLLVEAGPGQTLAAFARRHRAVREQRSAVVPLLPAQPGGPETDLRSVLDALDRVHAPATRAGTR
ncbi:acyl transferase family protein [Prauserella shujinwangii]|uniref:Acyl transferase family protein n=1 Tax=Prauserella shujinwangii TaxID=1453103 RepID=A0A2T0M3U9_9PSEU|nr:acyltransferase domain-containing protein [Prauserella shujinwangii]PRX51428.1 acyl transferase family protein [Prauserella shujinwangii]